MAKTINQTTTLKIKGLKKAVGEYKRYNAGGYYSPEYGRLMFDTKTGELWTDYFYSIGHQSWNEYHSETIVNLGKMMERLRIEINMQNVKEFIIDNLTEITEIRKMLLV